MKCDCIFGFAARRLCVEKSPKELSMDVVRRRCPVTGEKYADSTALACRPLHTLGDDLAFSFRTSQICTVLEYEEMIAVLGHDSAL